MILKPYIMIGLRNKNKQARGCEHAGLFVEQNG